MYINEGYKKQNTIGFPIQRKPTNQKGKKFCKECADYVIDSLTGMQATTLRQSFQNMDENLKLANGELIEDWGKRMSNPWGLNAKTFPAKAQHYPIANIKFDLLIGEEWKRKFDWICSVINPEAVSEKSEKLKGAVINFLLEKIFATTFDPETIEKEVAEIDKLKTWTLQDLREKRATELLNYLWKKNDLKIQFNFGMNYVLNVGEEIYAIDIYKGEPKARVVDSRSLVVYRNGNSPFIQDADIIVESRYMSIGQVADLYKLDSKEVSQLELGIDKEGNTLTPYPGTMGIPNSDMDLVVDISDLQNNGVFSGPYDSQGNVRVSKVCWKTLRKIGKISFYDEEGYLHEDIVDEYYVPNEDLGEEVQWEWIPEWMKTTRIGLGLYKDMGFIHGNFNPYVGTIYSIGNYSVKSLRDRTKPFEYLYDVIMYRTEKAFAKAKGIIGLINTAMIPDDWELDKWLYYGEEMGWAPLDPFSEGKKGQAMGKLAGNMSAVPTSIDMQLGNYIQQHIGMLEFLENKIGEITGVSKQREGQIENRETVGGVERAVTQSSHITEKWFALHDYTKICVLRELLQAAKYAYRDKKESIQYVTDDVTQAILEIDGQMLREIDLGVDITNSPDDVNAFNLIKQMLPNLVANDRRALSTIISITTSKSLAAIRNKVEELEEESIIREQEAMQMQEETKKQIAEANMAIKQEELRIQEENNIRDNQTALATKEMDVQLKIADMSSKGEGEDANVSLKKLQQMQDKIDKDYQMRNEELKEKRRNNLVKESLESKKIVQSKNQSKKP